MAITSPRFGGSIWRGTGAFRSSASNAADEALNVRILPVRAWRAQHLFDAEIGDGAMELFAVTAIAVVK